MLTRAGSLEEDYEDGVKPAKEDLSEKQQHQLKHRELFLSRQVETLPATHIRGKCTVTLLNETESLLSYLNGEVSAFSCTLVCQFVLCMWSAGVVVVCCSGNALISINVVSYQSTCCWVNSATSQLVS